MTVRLFSRDTGLRRSGEIEDYAALRMQLKFNDVSQWSLELPSAAADLLASGAGLIVERDGVTLMSGPALSWQRSLAADGSVRTQVEGVDDTVVLARRVVLPDPFGSNSNSVAYDTTTGPAETVLRYYVDRNAGPSAVTARQIPGLTLATDQGRGSNVRGQGRYGTLLETLQPLATAGGDLGFRVVQVGTAVQFQVYQPVDRTATAKFSTELGNLRTYDYRLTSPTANYIYGGGQGDLTARLVSEAANTASVTTWGRIESFYSRTDINDATAMATALTDELAQRTEQTGLSMSPIDTPAVRFGVDYNLGDRVSVVVGTVTITDVVRQVTLELTGEGERLLPLVGTAGAPNPAVPRLFDRLADSEARISTAERR